MSLKLRRLGLRKLSGELRKRGLPRHRRGSVRAVLFRPLLLLVSLLGCPCLGYFSPSVRAQRGSAAASVTPASSELREGRKLLQTHQYSAAEAVFASFLRTHPADAQAELGLGDAQLGLRQYESAEATYRLLVAQQPELWQAHKNLVIVEAALRRWEDFEGERKILRLARERGAPGISTHESDVVDSFETGGQRWVVRSYFEPLGRSGAVYNFERFSPAGRVLAYLSLEDAAGAVAALRPGDVRIGAEPDIPDSGSGGAKTHPPKTYALNWYTGTAHGTIRQYPAGEPAYAQLRRDILVWLRSPSAKPVRLAR